MPKFDNGIKFYTKGKLNSEVFFPEDEIKCQYCPFLSWNEELKIGRCRVNDGMIYSPFILSPDCPLTFEEEK